MLTQRPWFKSRLRHDNLYGRNCTRYNSSPYLFVHFFTHDWVRHPIYLWLNIVKWFPIPIQKLGKKLPKRKLKNAFTAQCLIWCKYSGVSENQQSGFLMVKKWAVMECSGIPMESVLQTKKSQFWRRMLKAPPLNPLTYIFSVFCSILPPSYWDQTNTIILTALCLVYIIISINVGLRNKRGSF